MQSSTSPALLCVSVSEVRNSHYKVETSTREVPEGRGSRGRVYSGQHTETPERDEGQQRDTEMAYAAHMCSLP